MGMIVTGVGSPGTISTATGGKITAALVGTTGAVVIGANPSRQVIVFHNPTASGNNLYVYQTVNAVGGVNAPTLAAPQGSFIVLPGATLTVTGECQNQCAAFASGANSPLTISESNL
jgi:hypothetical protein